MQLYSCFSFLVFSITVQGCISSGDADNGDALSSRALELQRNRGTDDDRFVRDYLKNFGYLKAEEGSADEVKEAVKSFQSFFGIPSTGEVDAQTSDIMKKMRCGNADVNLSDEGTAIWDKSVLNWNMTRFPRNMNEADFRSLLQMAFSAWETVIPIDFVEVHRADKADIVISFEEDDSEWQTDPTQLTIARASGPIASRIYISADEAWGSANEGSKTKTDLFNVLVHELGHVLGMRHSQDANSMMYPLFERSLTQESPTVTADDVERLRNYYHIDDTANDVETLDFENVTFTSVFCPRYIQSATNAPDGRWLVFQKDKMWQVYNQTVITTQVEINKVFPSPPPYVNASASVGALIMLISDRQIYGYLQTETNGQFSVAEGFPKTLHSRVLFYPEAAFPLANGSVILLSDNVFATYDLAANAPTFLNDKTVYFPNLPEGLVSGIPQKKGSEERYWMLTESTAYDYDGYGQKIDSSEEFTTFFTCNF